MSYWSESGCWHCRWRGFTLVMNPYREGWKPRFIVRPRLMLQFAINKFVLTWWFK